MYEIHFISKVLLNVVLNDHCHSCNTVVYKVSKLKPSDSMWPTFSASNSDVANLDTHILFFVVSCFSFFLLVSALLRQDLSHFGLSVRSPHCGDNRCISENTSSCEHVPLK